MLSGTITVTASLSHLRTMLPESRAFGGSAAEHFSAYSFNMSQPAPAAAYAANIVPLSSQLSLSWYFYNVKNVVSILYKYAKTILLKPFYQLLILMQL